MTWLIVCRESELNIRYLPHYLLIVDRPILGTRDTKENHQKAGPDPGSSYIVEASGGHDIEPGQHRQVPRQSGSQYILLCSRSPACRHVPNWPWFGPSKRLAGSEFGPVAKLVGLSFASLVCAVTEGLFKPKGI